MFVAHATEVVVILSHIIKYFLCLNLGDFGGRSGTPVAV